MNAFRQRPTLSVVNPIGSGLPGDELGRARRAKAPTLRDVAKLAGCSTTTVSLVLKGCTRILPETRDRVTRAVRKVGYSPNSLVSHVMAQLRNGGSVGFRGKLALINVGSESDVLRAGTPVAEHIRGCEDRANALGYSFDRFWAHESGLSAPRLLTILRARAMRGVVIAGMVDGGELPASLSPVLEAYPAVTAGVKVHQQRLPYASVDYHQLVFQSVERAVERGYRRFGLVVSSRLDQLVDYRVSAALAAAQAAYPHICLAPLFEWSGAGATDERLLHWLSHYKPEVVLAFPKEILRTLRDSGRSIPEDVGLILLEKSESDLGIAGMMQNAKSVGEAAVDLLVERIQWQDIGFRRTARGTLVEPTWSDGQTLRRDAFVPADAR